MPAAASSMELQRHHTRIDEEIVTKLSGGRAMAARHKPAYQPDAGMVTFVKLRLGNRPSGPPK